MDLSKLTTRHLIFIQHTSRKNYYAIDWIGQQPAEDYLHWLESHDGIFYPIAFAFYYPLENHFNEFENFIKEKIAPDYFTEGNKLIRDFYCFENFDESNKWIELFKIHREAQLNFWLTQNQNEKSETAYQQSSFKF